MIKTIKQKERGEEGFSLIELVVAVGILLVLTVGGVLAYNGITQNAREAAVDSAASEVLTGAIAYDSNGQNYEEAAKEWNKSAKRDNDDIQFIVVDSYRGENKEICITAEMAAHEIKVERGAGCDGSTLTPETPEIPGEGEETILPPVDSGSTSEIALYIPTTVVSENKPNGTPFAVEYISEGSVIETCESVIQWGRSQDCFFETTVVVNDGSEITSIPSYSVRITVDGVVKDIPLQNTDFNFSPANEWEAAEISNNLTIDLDEGVSGRPANVVIDLSESHFSNRELDGRDYKIELFENGVLVYTCESVLGEWGSEQCGSYTREINYEFSDIDNSEFDYVPEYMARLTVGNYVAEETRVGKDNGSHGGAFGNGFLFTPGGLLDSPTDEFYAGITFTVDGTQV